jgi:plastocyanin
MMINAFSSVYLAGLLMLSAATASAATFNAQINDQQGQPLSGAVLTLKGPAGTAPLVLKADMDQRDKEFVPRVLAVHTGTQVKFPNSDNIRHQV